MIVKQNQQGVFIVLEVSDLRTLVTKSFLTTDKVSIRFEKKSIEFLSDCVKFYSKEKEKNIEAKYNEWLTLELKEVEPEYEVFIHSIKPCPLCKSTFIKYIDNENSMLGGRVKGGVIIFCMKCRFNRHGNPLKGKDPYREWQSFPREDVFEDDSELMKDETKLIDWDSEDPKL